MNTKPIRCLAALLAALACASAAAQVAQLPDFTYQGRLSENGQPANGTYDLSFTLYDDAGAGQAVGTPQFEPQFPVVDGVFTTSLAFPGVFTGTQLWLEVGVNGQPLLPRRPVSTTPVAQYALSGNPGPAGPQGPAGPSLLPFAPAATTCCSRRGRTTARGHARRARWPSAAASASSIPSTRRASG